MTAALALAVLLLPVAAHASVSDAQKAYAAGHFDDAARAYDEASKRDPNDARLAFDAGDAAYRAGKYDVAVDAFARALATADATTKEHVLYNQGDALYRAGEARRADARDETIARWKAAIASYERALAIAPNDADARFNRDFVKRKLDELERTPKDDPKQKDDPKENEKKDAAGAQGSKSETSGNEAKPSAANGDKRDAKGTQGSAPHNQAGKDGTAAEPRGAAPRGTNDAQQARDGQDEKVGQLSPREARSLLGALRGDERHGAWHGADAGTPADETPRKDW